MLAQSFGADAWLAGVIGDDFVGNELGHLCKESNVSVLLATEADRITTFKERRTENGRLLPDRTDQ
jgi:bifunctional ADP-heptose synthase (sugar kinase/adenylyltransferase)